jgi:hypothetical protein
VLPDDADQAAQLLEQKVPEGVLRLPDHLEKKIVLIRSIKIFNNLCESGGPLDHFSPSPDDY